MLRPDRMLSNAAWSTLIALALIPALFSAGPVVERRYFPVVENVEVLEPSLTDEGVTFFVTFDKVRYCEFIGVAWYADNVRVGVEFEPGANLYPQTRPAGDQYAGPWLVRNVGSLVGTEAVVQHRCHPLWITESTFYDGMAE